MGSVPIMYPLGLDQKKKTRPFQGELRSNNNLHLTIQKHYGDQTEVSSVFLTPKVVEKNMCDFPYLIMMQLVFS